MKNCLLGRKIVPETKLVLKKNVFLFQEMIPREESL